MGRPATTRTWVEHLRAVEIADVPADCRAAGLAELVVIWPDSSERPYPVRLATTPQANIGGLRYWFLCPDCARRVSKLYVEPETRRLACRTCLGLVYASEYCKTFRQRVLLDFLRAKRAAERSRVPRSA